MSPRNEAEITFEETLLEEIADAVKRSDYLRWSLAGDLQYAANVIRNAAKRHEASDPSETSVHRANMRACATRLARLARLLPIVSTPR